MQLFGKITKADLYRRLLGFYGMDNKISPLKQRATIVLDASAFI